MPDTVLRRIPSNRHSGCYDTQAAVGKSDGLRLHHHYDIEVRVYVLP